MIAHLLVQALKSTNMDNKLSKYSQLAVYIKEDKLNIWISSRLQQHRKLHNGYKVEWAHFNKNWTLWASLKVEFIEGVVVFDCINFSRFMWKLYKWIFKIR